MNYHRTNLGMLLLLAAALLAPGGCKKKQPAGPDLSNPKAAALAFTRALESGDVATARRASNASGIEKDLIEAMAQSAVGIKALYSAATAKFGDEAKLILTQQSLSVTENLVHAEVAQGDTRDTVKSKDGRDTLHLHKIDGVWKVDVGALIKGKDVTNVVPFFRAAGLAATSVADDINSGKITKVEEARAQMTRRVMTHLPRFVREQYEASTRPARDELSFP